MSPTLKRVLTSAAQLQVTVPDAVLVGGSAAALHAGHRDSFDHDHVLADLIDRYEAVLDAVEATQGWATSVRASKPPFTIMGSLGGIEAGLRDHLGESSAVAVLADIGAYYADRSDEPASVLTSLVIALADPQPRDPDVIHELSRYKGLDKRWHRWDAVVGETRELALRLSGAT